jgi:hypothetical protein
MNNQVNSAQPKPGKTKQASYKNSACGGKKSSFSALHSEKRAHEGMD